MEIVENKVQRKFGWKDKISYAMGDFGCNMSFALNATITTFYTMYIGLSTEIMAIIILLLKIWDGINDPIMGAIMDKFKPKKNGSKFMPFIFFGSIALIISGALVFLPIPQAPTLVKILVCILGYLVWDTAYTIVNVPYGSLASVITTDSQERSSLSLWRSVGAMLANIPIMVLLPVFMYKDRYENGQPVYVPDDMGKPTQDVVQDIIGQNVFIIALILGVFGFIAFQILIRGTIERVKVNIEEIDIENKKVEKVSYWRTIKAFCKNRAAIGMTIASLFQLIMLNGLSVASAALFKDFFHQAQLSGVLQLISYLPLFIAMPLIRPLVKKFGKKEASQWPLLIGVIAGFLMMILPIKGDTTGMILWLILQLIVSCSFAVFATVGWAMIADCIDYQELKTGRREEGTVYAVYSLGRKIAQGLGAATVLLILGWLGFKEAVYNAELGVNIVQTQTPEVANRIRVLIGAVYFVCLLVQFIMIKFVYPLGKKEVEEMNIKLGRIDETFFASKSVG